MQSSEDAVCTALGVDINSAAIYFIHFSLIFISIDKVKLINQCQAGELDTLSFNLSQCLMIKLYRAM